MDNHKECKFILYFLIYIIILIENSCCDNGTEFKGEFLNVLKYYGIPVINRRAYHPQSQGSVEQANATFKRQLSACQAKHGGT